MQTTLDSFTRAYIITALWSSTEYKHGECPCCGRVALLNRYPEPEYEQVAMCDADGCGAREIANPDPMDDNYSESDIAPETLAKIIADCEQFQRENDSTIQAAIDTGEVVFGPDFDAMGRAGHDFWLSRNGHGAGFFDGDWTAPYGDQLQAAAKAFSPCDLYCGDDGKIYC